jgi:uncharacterized membrane protein YphA (DoxX/SURF4 family)
MDIAPATAVLTAFIGILFIYSGLAKLLTLRRFTDALLLLPHIPHRFAPSLATAIATLEVIAGLCAFCGLLWAKFLIIAMLVVFCVIAAMVRASGQQIRCNCFGSQESELLSGRTISRNCVLLTITFAGLFSENTAPTLLAGLHGLALLCLFLSVTALLQNQVHATQLRNGIST